MNKVSCLTITKNRVPYLKKCIQYFNKQTYKNKELVIIYYDTDLETEQYLLDNKQVLLKNNVYFFKFVSFDNATLGTVRNFGVDKTNGDWICIWDDDDVYHENRIKEQIEFCLKYNMLACTLSSLYVYYEKLQTFRLTFERYHGWEGSLMIKKHCIPKYHNLQQGEDTPILLEIQDYDWFGTLTNPNLYIYVFHENNTSGQRHITDIYNNSHSISNELTRNLHNLII